MDITKNYCVTRMRIFDVKFQAHKVRYISQCLLTAGAVCVVLLQRSSIYVSPSVVISTIQYFLFGVYHRSPATGPDATTDGERSALFCQRWPSTV